MDLAGEQKSDMAQHGKPEEKRIAHLVLESCTTEELCGAVGGNDKLLVELRNKLRDWLALQPHLPQDIPDERLDYFILNRSMSLEQAKQKLDMYYTIRRLIPELFSDRDPRNACFTMLEEYSKWVCLPKLTPEKYRVSIMKTMGAEVANFDIWVNFKNAFMISDVRISECRAQGDVFIYDLQKMRLGYLARITPTVIKKCEIALTKAFSIRIKGIHFLNAPPFIDRIISMMKSVLKPKIASRVHVHSNYDSIYDYVPKAILPVDYGGDEPSMDEFAEMWKLKLDGWRDWFLEQENVTVNENLRPGPSFDVDKLFGFSGSFRKLEVD